MLNQPTHSRVAIIERGWGTASISVELDAHYYTARAHRHLNAGLPDATIGDNGELVNWVRLVKSENEIGYMREAGQICTQVMNRAIELPRPGTPQNEIIAAVYATQVLGLPGRTAPSWRSQTPPPT